MEVKISDGEPDGDNSMLEQLWFSDLQKDSANRLESLLFREKNLAQQDGVDRLSYER